MEYEFGAKEQEAMQEAQKNLRIGVDLEHEAQKQPILFAYYADYSARANGRADQAKSNLKAVIAKKKNELRASGDKSSETKLQSVVDEDPLVIKAERIANRLRAEADFWKLMMESWRQRKDMLSHLMAQERDQRRSAVYRAKGGASED